jgi:hypothetical protein
MPYRINANTKGGGLYVIVETLKDALAKAAELVDLGFEVAISDLEGQPVDIVETEGSADAVTFRAGAFLPRPAR